jgi:hypothetical protein
VSPVHSSSVSACPDKVGVDIGLDLLSLLGPYPASRPWPVVCDGELAYPGLLGSPCVDTLLRPLLRTSIGVSRRAVTDCRRSASCARRHPETAFCVVRCAGRSTVLHRPDGSAVVRRDGCASPWQFGERRHRGLVGDAAAVEGAWLEDAWLVERGGAGGRRAPVRMR